MRHLIPLTLLLTTACTVGPDYTGPSAATPPPPVSFVRAQNAGVAAAADGPWWTTLRDPLLDKLVTQALKDSPDLSAAAARIRQARATLRERRAADLPSISSSALFAKARLPGQSEDGGATDLTLYNLGFDSSWELDLFGGRSRGLEATRADVAARTAELEDARVTLSAEVARTYVNLRERQQRLALAEAAIALRTREVELLRQRAASGTVGRDALLTGQQALDDARAQSGPLRAEIDGAKDRLALLAGTTPGSLDAQLDAPAPVPLPPAEVAIGDPAALLKRRPDIRVAERTLAAQTARIGEAEAARFPRVSFLGLFGLGGSSPADMFDLDKVTVAAAPRLSWTLLDFGRARAKVRGAEAQRDEAEARYRATVLGALQDAEAALSRFHHQRVALADRLRAERQAQQADALAAERYAAGTIALGDRLAAQRTLLAASQARQQDGAALTDAYIAVQKALGLGWQDIDESVTNESR